MTEKERQQAKEQAILLALRHGMALLRRGLEMHGMKVDGTTEHICTGSDYDNLWQEALSALQQKFREDL